MVTHHQQVLMNRIWYLLLVLLMCSGLAVADEVASDSPLSQQEVVSDFLQVLYAYDFTKAQDYISQLDELQLDHPLDYLMHIHYHWWMIVSGEQEPDNFNSCFNYIDSTLNYIQSLPDEFQNPEVNFMAISALSYKFRLNMMRESQVAALRCLHKIGSYSQVIVNEHDKYPYFKLPAAIYHFAVCSAAEKYPFANVCLIMFPEADKETGKQLLESNIKSEDILIRTESLYFLMRYYLELEENYSDALKYSNVLVQCFPDNLLYRFFQLRILNKLYGRQLQESVADFNNRIRNNNKLSDKQKKHFTLILKQEMEANL